MLFRSLQAPQMRGWWGQRPGQDRREPQLGTAHPSPLHPATPERVLSSASPHLTSLFPPPPKASPFLIPPKLAIGSWRQRWILTGEPRPSPRFRSLCPRGGHLL